MDSFGSRATLTVGTRNYDIFRLDSLAAEGVDVSRLPFSLRILLENLLRTTKMVARSLRTISARSQIGTPMRRLIAKSLFRRPACSCRTSPVSPPWWTLPLCAMRWRASEPMPQRSTRFRRPNW